MSHDEDSHAGLNRRHFLAQGSALAMWPACEAQAQAARPVQVMPLTEGWTVREAAGPTRVPAAVPGFVQSDLVAAGKLPPLNPGMNLEQARPVAEKRWIYETRLRVPAGSASARRHDLVFMGLDCFAEVFLNGQRILKSDNAFLRHRVRVEHLLRPGDNRLEVRFDPTRQRLRRIVDSHPYYNDVHRKHDKDFLRKYARKAQYQFGWDWARELNTVGIWRAVQLESWDEARVADLQVHVEDLSAGQARLRVEADIRAALALPGTTVEVTVRETGRVVRAAYDLREGDNRTAVSLSIDQPRLWWPAGLGEQALYHVELRLRRDGRLLAEATRRTGLRTTELVQARDAVGQSFFLKVNGLPVFNKGANYVPVDMLLPQVTPARYRQLLEQALAAHMNTLRVWGGGIYEDDVFYDLCDELGLMVYQDFMFASGMPPADEVFLRSVEREARQEVLRLRNHPCVVLWAGDNENESSWFEFPKGLPEQVFADYARIQHQLLPGIVRALSPEIPYTRSSPSANLDGVRPNTPGWGDTHAWAVWFEKFDLENDSKDRQARYASEYGFVGYPPMRSVRKALAPAQRDRTHAAWRYHDAYDGIQETIDDFLRRYYHLPDAVEDYVYLSGLMQAEAMRVTTERYRRLMPQCMGALIWQLNDVWPVASWALVDYFGEWKAAQYAVRDAFAPLLLSAVEQAGKVRVWLVSDRRETVQGRLTLTLLDFDGERRELPACEVSVRYGESVVVAELDTAELLQGRDPRRAVLVARCSDAQGQVMASQQLYFRRPRDLDLPPARVQAKVAAGEDGSLQVTLRSALLARQVFLDSGGLEGHWQDNYFDLLPGEARTVRFTPHGGAVETAALRQALSLRTLTDAMGVRR